MIVDFAVHLPELAGKHSPTWPARHQRIPLELLICVGRTPAFICRLLNYALEGDRILSDCPAIDQKLLDQLYRSAGIRQEFELEDAIIPKHLAISFGRRRRK